jgi:hypothetical protein
MHQPIAVKPGGSMATLSLIAGIATWICFPVVGACIALVLGYASHAETKRWGWPMQGNAVAGIALGGIQLALLAAVLLFWGGLAAIGIVSGGHR